MEIVSGWTHRAFPIDDASRIGEARRYAAQAVEPQQWTEEDAGRLALIITELGSNLHRHARNGRLLIAPRPDTAEMEVIAIDDGPGIVDLSLSMQDGHSSGSTPGTGLGAIRRLADDFDIHSSVPAGTVTVACVRKGRAAARPANPLLQIGAICLPVAGETVCGDAWGATIHADGCALMMADGLGHGPEAAKASQAALAVFRASPGAELRDTVQRAHAELRTTRGAALCIASLDSATVTYTGAGNIIGRVLSGTFDKSIVTQHGTAGLQIRTPQLATIDMPEHALLILHSDGIETRWKGELLWPVLQRSPTLVAALLLRDHARHRDDATVVVLRRKG
ncbi:MAG TPA: ATP-binding protein [Bordetella sp.]|nr:ATP-binding protein [Bordetella sp.]